MNTASSDELRTPLFPIVTVYAALCAFALLPIGMFLGTTNFIFVITSYAHTGLLAAAAVLAIQYFVRVVLKSKSSPVWPISLFVLFCVLTFLNAGPPPTNPNALSGPLYTIKYWTAIGEIRSIPWNYDAFTPHLPSLTQAVFLPVIGHMTFPIYSLLTLIITAAAVTLLCYRYTRSALMGACGFILFFTLPLFQKLSVDYSLDGSLALYATLSLFYLLRWIQNEKPVRALTALGIVLGALAACGFRGMGLTALCVLLLPLLGLSKNVSGGRLLLALLVVPTLAAVGVLPWLARNLIWTMNPVFPFGKEFLGASPSGVVYQSVEPMLITEWFTHSGLSLLDLLILPFHYVVPSPEATALLGAKLSPLLLLSCFSILFVKKPAIGIPFFIGSLYFVGAVLLFPPRTVVLTPIIPFFCYLSIVGLDQAARWCKEHYKIAAHLLLGIHAVFALFFAFELVTDIRPFAFLKEKDANSYLASKIPEFSFIQKINRSIPPFAGDPTDTTLYLAGVSPAFYYYDVDIRKDTTARPDFLLRQLVAHESVEQLRSAFVHQGMKMILANKKVLEKELVSGLPAERHLWRSFRDTYLEVVAEDESFVIWRILSERSSNAPEIDPLTGKKLAVIPQRETKTEAMVATDSAAPAEAPSTAEADSTGTEASESTREPASPDSL